MEGHGDENDRSSDGGDMFDDLSVPEESGDLRVDAPHHADQVGDDSQGVDMDAYASGSASMFLSPDMNESAELGLPRSETSADSRLGAGGFSPHQAAASVRGSCEELEARIGAMLAEDCDTAVNKDEACVSVPVLDDLQLGATMEIVSNITDQLGSNDGDIEASDRDAEPGTELHGEIYREGMALKASNAAELMERQDEIGHPDALEHDCLAPPGVPNDSCGQRDATLNEDATDDSNVDNGSSRGRLNPVSIPTHPSPMVDADVEGELITSLATIHDEGARVHISTTTTAAQKYHVDDEVLCASPTPRHSASSSGFAVGYSVATVFPVVYESVASNSVSTESKLENDVTAARQASPSLSVACAPAASSAPHVDSSKQVESRRVARLQRQLEAAERELRGAKKSFALQLSVLESDKKMPGSRNARLHSQLTSVTSDLQRVSSDLARVRTENELYAAKLPQLQAELLQETTQVDEGRSHSLQAQLSIGQLKARAQVIQKRNEALEAANAKLTAKLREGNQELRRKTDTVEQQASRIAQLEMSFRDQKTKHNDEVMTWKHRLASASQRAQQELSKAASEWSLKSEKQSLEAKRLADRAAKKCRELEACVSRLEEADEKHKRDICAHQERVASVTKEVAAVKSVLKRVSQTEAALRNELAAIRGRLRDAERDQRVSKERFGRSSALGRTRSRRRETLEVRCVCISRCDCHEDCGQVDTIDSCSCRFHDRPMAKPATSDAATMTMETTPACGQCPKLAQQMRVARQEITRVRALHAQELRAQVQAIEAVLMTSKLAHQVKSA